MKIKFSIRSFLFANFIIWFLSLIWLFIIPNDPKNAWLFGVSQYRLLMIFFAGLSGVGFLSLWLKATRNLNWYEQIESDIASFLCKNDRALFSIAFSLIGFLSGCALLMFSFLMTNHFYQAVMMRINPLILGVTSFCFFSLIFLLYGDLGINKKDDKSLQNTKESEASNFQIRTCIGILPISKKIEDLFIIITGIILALLLRVPMLQFSTGDIEKHFGLWVDYMRANNGIFALKTIDANYTPIYLYLMLLSSTLGFSAIVTVKLVSIVFDLICAYFVYKIVQIKYPTGSLPIFALLVTLLLPTVVVNSALWGQNDVIFTSGFLAFLYFLLKKREIPAFIALGFAFAVKLQTIILAPLLLIMLLNKKIKLRSFLIIPGMYFLSILPAWIVGRPLTNLLSVYLGQVRQGVALSHSAPNLYEWLPTLSYEMFLSLRPSILIWVASFVFLFSAAVYRGKLAINPTNVIKLITFSTFIMPFILPTMRERYFYPADIFSIILVFYAPYLFFVPILTQIASGLSYLPNLFNVPLGLEKYLAILQLVAIIALGRDLVKTWVDERVIRNEESH